MKTQHKNWGDEDGNPIGGSSCGRGYNITWQCGPLSEERNGALPEHIIKAVKQRIQNDTKNGEEPSNNAKQAIRFLELALSYLGEPEVDHLDSREKAYFVKGAYSAGLLLHDPEKVRHIDKTCPIRYKVTGRMHITVGETVFEAICALVRLIYKSPSSSPGEKSEAGALLTRFGFSRPK